MMVFLCSDHKTTDGDKAYVQEVLQQTWESTDEWFYK